MISINVFIIIFISQIILFFVIEKLNIKNFFAKYSSIQKIHDGEVLRIGGLFYFLPLILLYFFNENFRQSYFNPVILCCSIIFVSTLIEDIKHTLSAKFRLLILFIGSLIFVLITDLPEIKISNLIINDQNIILYELLFVLSLMLIMNGFNFIDGLNGLSSFNFIVVLFNIFFLADLNQDVDIINLVILLFSLSIFFLILNFPFGKFFLGDSGSYLYAFLSGTLVIVLFQRNPELPSLLALLILAYPITETIFSIFRKIINKFSPMEPDNLHLHHLIYGRLTGSKIFKNNLAALLMLPFWFGPFLLILVSHNFNLHNLIIYSLYLLIYVSTYYVLKKI